VKKQLSVRILTTLAIVVASLLILGTVIPSKATSMETILSPDENEAVVRYESIQVLNIKYPNGGDIRDKLVGQNVVLEFSVDSSNHAMQTLMEDMMPIWSGNARALSLFQI
jgi:hypothetical protein